jgi:hypoxanthine phosphoribosyltransferase
LYERFRSRLGADKLQGRAGVASVTKLYDEDEISRRVEELAGEIAAVVSGDFAIVALLKGSFVFVADLLRVLGRHGLAPTVEFMRVSSYGAAKESSGEVRLIGEVPEEVAGRPVLVVDDIVDTGRSLAYARDRLAEAGASKVWTCTLLDKPSRREVEFSADFVGFVIEDVFVVGYGIDFAEQHRHLPYIGVVG